MKLYAINQPEGAVKSRKRLGRGVATGNGKTSGKGHKGQNARSGGGVRPGLKVDNYHYSEDYQKEVSLMHHSKLNMQQLM